MIITSQKGRGNKIHILIDGEYQITTNVDFWAENFIKDGTEIYDEEWHELCGKINYRKALSKCYDFLSNRAHSEFELRQKLGRTYDEDVIDRVIEHAKRLGYIDDEAFAESYARSLLERKHFSLYRIKQELYKKRIDREIIDNIVSELEIDAVASIVELLETKFRNKLGDEKAVQRTKNALLRLGYGYSDIKAAFARFAEYNNFSEDD